MKKVIRYLLLVIAILLGLSSNSVQASSSDLFLNHLDFSAQINDDGSMNVTEIWNINIKDTNTLYKTFLTDKTKYSNITNVKVIEETDKNKHILNKQNQWSYHLPKGNYFGGINQDNEFEIAWGVGLENSSARKIYQVSYQVQDAVAKYNDYAELYWQFVGKDFEIDSKNITGMILLPSHANQKEDIKVWGHTEDLNGEIYVTGTNKIEFNIQQFREGRYVEIRTLFPAKMITTAKREKNEARLEQVIQEETTWANQANSRRKMKETTKKIFGILINIVAIIATIFSIKSILKNIRKIKQSKKLVPTQEIQYYREMPREDATPAQALAILTKQVAGTSNSMNLGKIFTATLLDLSLKKIIEFQLKDKIITIKILKENPEELEKIKDEQVIFEFLKKACEKNNSEITTKELEKYIKKSQGKVLKLGEKIDKHIGQELLVKQELTDGEGTAQREKLTVYMILLAVLILFFAIPLLVMLSSSKMNPIGLILFMTILIIQLIVFAILMSKTNVLTQKGVDENAKWKGLKKYMEDFSMLDKKEIPEIVIWEKFLVYATAFGIADKVLKQLKIVYPNMSEEIGTNHYAYMYLMMNTNFSSSFSNAVTNSMSAAYSSATGGGGGFSGRRRRSDGGRWRWRWKIATS